MRVPLSWLQDFVPLTDDVDKIADALNSLGLVVEGIERIGDGLDGVVIGHVLDVRQHPNADRVRLADIDLGDGEPVQIACGAANLEKGQYVPIATIGTTLPNGMTIEKRKLRGEWSNGMICSEDELGLARERSGGIMVLPNGLPLGAPFADAMGIEKDVVFDLEIETNRPDAMCISGVARDLAGRLGLPFAVPTPLVSESGPAVTDLVKVLVHDAGLCPRFSLRVVQNVTVGPSPELVSKRLTLAGMRPINNIVDASNYVMLELGQPTHPYDLSLLPGATLQIRITKSNEGIETLDGTVRRLPDGAGVLTDVNDVIVGVAGIMGGASSEIGAGTQQVALEAAVWEPYSINFTSRKLALRTDASARFERRVDREGTVRALDRIIEVLRQSSPDLVVATGVIDESALPAWPGDADHIRLRTARVNGILGTAMSDTDVAARLMPIGFATTLAEPGVHDVIIPSFRPDCEREIDVIEEVARMHGYENIERRVPTAPSAARLTAHQLRRRQLRSFLVGRGFSEAWTAALIGPDDLERARQEAKPIGLSNPVVREESVLRTSLLPGMLRSVAYNVARQNRTLQLFEIGHVFNQPKPGDTLPDEAEHVSVAITGDEVDARIATALWRDLCLTIGVHGTSVAQASVPGLHPGRSAVLQAEGVTLGVVGEIDPGVLDSYGIANRVAWLEIDTTALLELVEAVPQMSSISKFPSSEFDLAFVVNDEVPASAIDRTLREVTGQMLEELTLFDVFRSPQVGEGQRSLAYRLRLASLDGTLTDSQTAEVRLKAVEAVRSRHGASLRS